MDTETLMKRFAQNDPHSSAKIVETSQALKYQFQDFKFHDPSLSSFINVPQKEVVIRDAISGKSTVVKPPDIEIRNNSPYREKYSFYNIIFYSYFKMLSNDGNSFHLKKGRFTDFIDGKLPMDRERKYYNKEKD